MRKVTVGFMLVFAGGLMFWHAVDKSSTYDEVQHIQSGYYYWNHLDFSRGLEHPPLMRLLVALPLQFLNLTDPETVFPFLTHKPLNDRQEFLYGMLLVYKSAAANADAILFLSRAMIIITTLALFWLCWFWSTGLYGSAGGFATLFLLCTLPPFLAHGSLATTDAGGVAGAALAVYLLARYLKDPSQKNLVWAGLGLGVAHITKIYNLILSPITAVAVLFDPEKKQRSWMDKIIGVSILFLICAIVINASHAFQDFLPPHAIHPRDLAAYGWSDLIQFIYRWLPLPDSYLMNAAFGSYHSKAGYATFFLGKLYARGVWYYFPILFWMKAPVMSLAAVLAVIYSMFRAPLKAEEKLILSVAAIYAFLACRSGFNLGIRHFLLIYVLLFVLAGRLFQDFAWDRKKIAVLTCAAVFQIFEVFSVAPHFLTYFNWAVGGSGRGIYYASEFDMGQDLKRLGKFMKGRPGAELILSYMGTALPDYYGLDAQELIPTGTQIHSEKMNSDRPEKEFLAVSAAHLQGYMVGLETFEWLRARRPEAVIGHSIYVYDVTNDTESHLRLAEIYRLQGDAAKAGRHFRRIKLI